MRRILLGVDFSSHSDWMVRGVLTRSLPSDTHFRIAIVAPKMFATDGCIGVGRLAMPTAAFVVPRPTTRERDEWAAAHQFNFVDAAATRVRLLAQPFIVLNYSVETVIHEGSVFRAIRSEVRSWKPSEVIVAVDGWYGLKRKVVELALQSMLDDGSDHAGPPIDRKRAA